MQLTASGKFDVAFPHTFPHPQLPVEDNVPNHDNGLVYHVTCDTAARSEQAHSLSCTCVARHRGGANRALGLAPHAEDAMPARSESLCSKPLLAAGPLRFAPLLEGLPKDYYRIRTDYDVKVSRAWPIGPSDIITQVLKHVTLDVDTENGRCLPLEPPRAIPDRHDGRDSGGHASAVKFWPLPQEGFPRCNVRATEADADSGLQALRT